MKRKRASNRNTDKIVTFVCSVMLVIIFLVAKAVGATHVKFTYPSGDGTSGRFIIVDEASGDSIAGGSLAETDRGAMTYWAGSATIGVGSYIVQGFIFGVTDTSAGSYRLDVYPQAINDTLLILQDSIESQDDVLNAITAYMGACDGCYQRLYPEGGISSKDSIVIIDPSLGNDSLVAKVVFKHGTTPSVYDTSYFYVAPWW